MTDQTVYFEVQPGPIIYGEQTAGKVILSGYVCGFEQCERYGGPEEGGWIELIERNAFVQALAVNPHMDLRINFDGLPLARTRSKSMTLSVDGTGLRVEATLPADEPRVENLVRRGENGVIPDVLWGFSFRVENQGQEWSMAPGCDDEYTYRWITKISLDKGDISLTAMPVEITAHAAQ